MVGEWGVGTGAAVGPASPQRPQQQGLQGAARGGDGALVDVLDGEAAPQHLDEDAPELPGRQVVEERVEHGAEVEEGVGYRVKDDVGSEVGNGPLGLGLGGHH